MSMWSIVKACENRTIARGIGTPVSDTEKLGRAARTVRAHLPFPRAHPAVWIDTLGRFGGMLEELRGHSPSERRLNKSKMSANKSYEEIIDFIAAGTTPETVFAFHPSDSRSACRSWSNASTTARSRSKSNLNWKTTWQAECAAVPALWP